MFNHFSLHPRSSDWKCRRAECGWGYGGKADLLCNVFIDVLTFNHGLPPFSVSQEIRGRTMRWWQSLHSSILGSHVPPTSASSTYFLCQLPEPPLNLIQSLHLLYHSLEFPDKIFQHEHLSMCSPSFHCVHAWNYTKFSKNQPLFTPVFSRPTEKQPLP